ncbi:hypothetical protein E4U48_004807 [Claviceps purpurea]|nr:hypothetical protein E4U48_004807 [Claviceps purpurea]
MFAVTSKATGMAPFFQGTTAQEFLYGGVDSQKFLTQLQVDSNLGILAPHDFDGLTGEKAVYGDSYTSRRSRTAGCRSSQQRIV